MKFILLILNLSFIAYAQSRTEAEEEQIKKRLNQHLAHYDTKVSQLRDLQLALQNQDLSDDEREAKKAEFAQKIDEANKLYQALNEHIVNAQNGFNET